MATHVKSFYCICILAILGFPCLNQASNHFIEKKRHVERGDLNVKSNESEKYRAGSEFAPIKEKFLKRQILSCLPQGKTVKLIQQLREQSEKLNAL